MNRRLIVLVTSLVLTFSITATGYGQKKGSKAAKAAPKQAATKAAPTTPVGENPDAMDLNSASVEKLMTLPGAVVDLMTAKKIVAARPFKNKNDIVGKKIMSQEDFNRIARSVTVKGAEKATPTKGRKS
jgi:DNA uptake protein ComE-like DNA-binding protein